MTSFVALKINTETLQKWSLPEQEYFLPTEALIAAASNQGKLLPELLLHGLQTKLNDKEIDKAKLLPGLEALCYVLYEPELEQGSECAGVDWSLKYGSIDLAKDEIVTIQCRNRLVAAFTLKDSQLVMCAYEFLDDNALSMVKRICSDLDPAGRACSPEKKFKYNIDRSGKISQAYASDAGNNYISYWQYGLGKSFNGEIVENWRKLIDLTAIPSMHTGTQLQVREFFHQPGFCFEKYMEALNIQPHLGNTAEQNANEVRDKFLGCMLGGAIGDAYGAPVEFISRERILALHGDKGVTSLLPAYGKVGAITDDTQMTLFTAEGLLRAYVKGKREGRTSWLGCIGHAYQRWLQTQSHSSPSDLRVITDGVLWQYPELHDQRAPGNTCLNALSTAGEFDELALNDSKGCGGVMRVAPIGLFCWREKTNFTLEDCFKLGCDAAQLTHGHPTGYLASGAFSAIIYQILDGYTLVDATLSVIPILKEQRNADETIDAIEQTLRLSKTQCNYANAIQQMGEGWIAEEALAISLYCAIVANDFNHLMSISVSHDGDSDSTGAISGNLWGALYGLNSIDEQLVQQVELTEAIRDIAKDLFEFPTWDIGRYTSDRALDNFIQDKYPGS
ncbi:ADP-ribosylglycohydrolase family protein [Aliiglaciecola sp. SL4]|uniref:ADP-ribosylglycohydrolase family protein n=1 Tax=Aliiglaciecola sp. SL4 TaxID=3239806 RepID=UPI00355C53E4